MKQLSILIFSLVIGCSAFSQENSKFSVEINYGLNGNFFVRDYNEMGGPDNKVYFYKKNFIGSIAGINLQYILSRTSAVFVEYNRSINMGKKNYGGTINGTEIFIEDFKLRHVNNIYLLGYAYNIKDIKRGFKMEGGLMLIYDAKQLIQIEGFDDLVRIKESNFKNANAVEGGVFLGAGFTKKIDTKFDLGIKARVYYLISTATLEAISISPTLTYRF